MFTVFVDDSGTAPEQKIAIAAALVIPSIQIAKLDSHWDSFRSKYGFTCFHSSVCAHRNSKSDFVNWPDDKIEKPSIERDRLLSSGVVRPSRLQSTKAILMRKPRLTGANRVAKIITHGRSALCCTS